VIQLKLPGVNDAAVLDLFHWLRWLGSHVF